MNASYDYMPTMIGLQNYCFTFRGFFVMIISISISILLCLNVKSKMKIIRENRLFVFKTKERLFTGCTATHQQNVCITFDIIAIEMSKRTQFFSPISLAFECMHVVWIVHMNDVISFTKYEMSLEYNKHLFGCIIIWNWKKKWNVKDITTRSISATGTQCCIFYTPTMCGLDYQAKGVNWTKVFAFSTLMTCTGGGELSMAK